MGFDKRLCSAFWWSRSFALASFLFAWLWMWMFALLLFFITIIISFWLPFSVAQLFLVPLAFALRSCHKVIKAKIKWMENLFFLFFSPPSYAALFLSRDSGCKNSLIWVVLLFSFLCINFTHKHRVIVLRVAVGALGWCEWVSEEGREGGHCNWPVIISEYHH